MKDHEKEHRDERAGRAARSENGRTETCPSASIMTPGFFKCARCGSVLTLYIGQLGLQWLRSGSCITSCSRCQALREFVEITREEYDEALARKNECFIATACYGNRDAPELVALRKYRDTCLLRKKYGAACVSLYYAVSPPFAVFLRRHPSLASHVRRLILDPIAARCQKAVAATEHRC